MNYREEVKDNSNKVILSGIPFKYDLTGAVIESDMTGIIFAPARIDPRINEIIMSQNLLKGEGLLELSKTLIFNKNIKIVDFHTSAVKSEDINYLNNGFGLFDNHSLEELNLSCNYLREDSEHFLSKLISHFKGLKSLNLSSNDLKNGVSSLFIALNKLYKEGKTKLESLNLNKCLLDDIAIYELGELLKSKYCLIKILSLNENAIPTNSNFFKAIKKNKSLEELYLYGCGITSDKTDEIDRIINNTNLESLYLYSNKIHDFNQYIRLIYRLSKIKNENEKKEKDIKYNISCLNNLNLNNAETYNQNSEKIQLIKKGIDKINVVCLDLTSVLKDINSANINFDYYKEVSSLLNDLKKKNDEYKKALNEIFVNEVDKKNYEVRLIGKNTDDLNDLDSFIKDPNSKYHNYIVKIAKHFISEKSFNNKKEEFDRIVNYINLKRVNLILDENKKIKADKKLILV